MLRWTTLSASLLLAATTAIAQPSPDGNGPKNPPVPDNGPQNNGDPKPNPQPRGGGTGGFGGGGGFNGGGGGGGGFGGGGNQRVGPNGSPQGPNSPKPINPPQVLGDKRAEEYKRAVFGSRTLFKPQAKMEKAAFLGVSGSPVIPALREQLKLPKGIGLVVDFVDAKSPAEEAGIKQYDVLHKLGDQLLVNPHQFATLVRTHKAGDEVELTVIRQGESKQLKVKLAEKEVVALDDTNPWGLPPGPWDQSTGADVLRLNVITADSPVNTAKFLLQHDTTGEMRFSDDKGTLLITKGRDGRQAVMSDKAGNVLFKGPIDTPEQLQKAPEDLRTKLQRMETRIQVMPPTGLPQTPESNQNNVEFRYHVDQDTQKPGASEADSPPQPE